jgi:hypothetical protein
MFAPANTIALPARVFMVLEGKNQRKVAHKTLGTSSPCSSDPAHQHAGFFSIIETHEVDER